MVSKKVTVNSLTGIHLRPAGVLCKAAMLYQATIQLKTDRKTVNAKSMLGVLEAGVKSGDQIEFICEGEDEQAALQAMLQLAATGFGDLPAL